MKPICPEDPRILVSKETLSKVREGSTVKAEVCPHSNHLTENCFESNPLQATGFPRVELGHTEKVMNSTDMSSFQALNKSSFHSFHLPTNISCHRCVLRLVVIEVGDAEERGVEWRICSDISVIDTQMVEQGEQREEADLTKGLKSTRQKFPAAEKLKQVSSQNIQMQIKTTTTTTTKTTTTTTTVPPVSAVTSKPSTSALLKPTTTTLAPSSIISVTQSPRPDYQDSFPPSSSPFSIERFRLKDEGGPSTSPPSAPTSSAAAATSSLLTNATSAPPLESTSASTSGTTSSTQMFVSSQRTHRNQAFLDLKRESVRVSQNRKAKVSEKKDISRTQKSNEVVKKNSEKYEEVVSDDLLLEDAMIKQLLDRSINATVSIKDPMTGENKTVIIQVFSTASSLQLGLFLSLPATAVVLAALLVACLWRRTASRSSSRTHSIVNLHQPHPRSNLLCPPTAQKEKGRYSMISIPDLVASNSVQLMPSSNSLPRYTSSPHVGALAGQGGVRTVPPHALGLPGLRDTGLSPIPRTVAGLHRQSIHSLPG